MSTKATIAIDPAYRWCVEEEMIDDTVWVVIEHGQFEASPDRCRLQLPPAALDAISEAHARKAFPHQRKREDA